MYSSLVEEQCRLKYFMLLYLLSDTNQRGILEFDYEDNLWFNTLCKRYRAEFNLLVDSIKLEEKLMDKYRREIKKYVEVKDEEK